MSRDLFVSEIFENSFSKFFSLSYSISLTILTTPLMFLIILYERDNPNRILLNQLVTSVAYLGIIVNLSIELIHIVLYSWGPLHSSLCNLSLILQGTFGLQAFLLMNAVMIVRYLFTFHVKNPTAAQHDFWTMLITTWTFLLAFFVQTIFVLWPGMNPAQFYVCIGSMTESLMMSKPKMNHAFSALFILTVIIHVCLGIKIKHYELKISHTASPLSDNLEKISILDKNRIVSATINLVVVLIWILICCPLFLINTIAPESINKYPNYLIFYYIHLVSVPTFNVLAVSVVLYRNQYLRTFIFRKVSTAFKTGIECQ